MKILITTSFYPPYHMGGACTHVKYLAEALVKKGYEVHVLCSHDAYTLKRGFEIQKEENKGVIVHRMKSPLGRLEPIFNYTFGTMPYTYNYFKKLIKKEKFDVVHHHNISLLGHKILRKTGNYKNLYTAHDYWLICPKYDHLKNKKICNTANNPKCILCCLKHKKPYPLNYIKSHKKSVNEIDLIIAPSKFMKKSLDSLNNKIKVINNFAQEYAGKLIKPEYNDYFLFSGQLEQHKGILQLAKLFEQMPDKKLVIAGDGSLKEEIKKISKKHNNIIYAGFVNQSVMYGLMKNANALILPSQWPENNSMVIIESYMQDTPAIASNLGGNPELIEMVDKKLCFQWNNFEQLKEITLNFNKEKYKKIPKLDFGKYLKTYLKLIK